MITGMWKNLRIICGNDHDEPQEMYVRQTEEDAFYCCPKYSPENRDEFERPCMNRISVAEVEKALDMIDKKIQDEEEQAGQAFVKNYKFSTRVCTCKVLEANGLDLTLRMLNKKAKAE